MQKPTFNSAVSEDDKEKLRLLGRSINGKAILGHVRLDIPEDGVQEIFVLEDGTEIMRDDSGKALKAWKAPDYQKARAKRALEQEAINGK